MVTIRITDLHLKDLQDLLVEKEAISDELIIQGKGHEACDMNEVCQALDDLIVECIPS